MAAVPDLPRPSRPARDARRPGLGAALQACAVTAIAAVLWLLYGGGYVTLDSMWAVVWGRDIAHADPLSVSGTTTPHVLSNLIGVALTPLGADADRGLVAIAFLAGGALVWAIAMTAREIAGTAAGVIAGVLAASREQLLYAVTSNFLDVLTAALVLWAALAVVRWHGAQPDAPVDGASVSPPWSASVLLFLAGLLRPEAWALAGALWLWTVRRGGGPAIGRLLSVVAAPASWLAFDAMFTGDALFSVHETSRVNAIVRAGREIPDTFAEHLISIPRTIALVAGPELLALALFLAVVVAWPSAARLGPWSRIVLEDRERGLLLVLLMGAAVFAGVIAAEALSGSLLFARFTLALMGVFVVASAVLVVEVSRAAPTRLVALARRPTVLAAALAAVLTLAQLPLLVDARRITGDEHDRYSVARSAVRPGLPCEPVATPNVTMRAFVAAWADLRGDAVIDAATAGVPSRGTYVTATGAEPERLLRDRNFPQLDVFPQAAPVRAVGGWIVTSRCSADG